MVVGVLLEVVEGCVVVVLDAVVDEVGSIVVLVGVLLEVVEGCVVVVSAAATTGALTRNGAIGRSLTLESASATICQASNVARTAAKAHAPSKLHLFTPILSQMGRSYSIKEVSSFPKGRRLIPMGLVTLPDG